MVLLAFLTLAKIDQSRRSTQKTGGEPPTVLPLTPSEEVLIQS